MAASFKILQISDLHFGDDANRLPSPVQVRGKRALLTGIASGYSGNWIHPATHSEHAARSVARYALEEIVEVDPPDLILVTGDIGATGSEQDLGRGSAYLGPHNGGNWWFPDHSGRFVSKGIPMVTVPGNHDRYQSFLVPGANAFDRLFAHSWNPSGGTGRVFCGPRLVRGRDSVVAVCGDFSLRTASEGAGVFGYIGQGKVHADVLAEMEQETKTAQDSGHSVFWAVHYPPSFPDGDPNLALRDSDQLVAAAARLGINLLFAGHTHRQLLYRLDALTVQCAGTATEADSNARWAFSYCVLDVHGSSVQGGRIYPFIYKKYGLNDFVQTATLTF